MVAARFSHCMHERPGSARGESARGLRKENPGDLSVRQRFNKCLSAFLKRPEGSTLLCWEQRDGVGTCQPRSLPRLHQHRLGGFSPSSGGKQVWVSECTQTGCLFCGKVLSVEGGERHITPQEDFLLIWLYLSSDLLP